MLKPRVINVKRYQVRISEAPPTEREGPAGPGTLPKRTRVYGERNGCSHRHSRRFCADSQFGVGSACSRRPAAASVRAHTRASSPSCCRRISGSRTNTMPSPPQPISKQPQLVVLALAFFNSGSCRLHVVDPVVHVLRKHAFESRNAAAIFRRAPLSVVASTYAVRSGSDRSTG